MSCSTGSMTARASSGSSSLISSVEPLMSAKSAVTVLRSPSMADKASACSGVMRISFAVEDAIADESGPGRAIAASAVPQSAQNLALAEVSVPHFGQRIGSGLPHSAQNRLPDKLSAPHFEQRILPHSGCDSFGPLQLCRLLDRVEALSCIG